MKVIYLLQNNTKQKILGFQNTRLILPWINFLWIGKFTKAEKKSWKLQALNQAFFRAEQVS